MEDPEEIVLETRRLALRTFTPADASFILDLLNQASFIRYIGDKGVRTLDDARRYIQDGPLQSYQRYGFGLYVVEEKQTATPIGMCGLLKRESLEDCDLGYAFLPDYWSQGYATEAAQAVVDYAQYDLGLHRVVAITAVDNEASIKLLNKLGFVFERVVPFPDDKSKSRLFGKTLV